MRPPRKPELLGLALYDKLLLAIKQSQTVEFAIKLPGPEENDNKVVWLTIDAKFPKED